EAGIWHRGRVGDSFPEVGFSIVSFAPTDEMVYPEDERQTPYVKADVRLIIFDQRTKVKVELNRSRAANTDPVAILRWSGNQIFDLRPGEETTFAGISLTMIWADANAGTARLRLGAVGRSPPEEVTLHVSRALR